MAEGEISEAAEEPGTRVDDFVPVGVEFEERVLDEILRGFALADQAVGIAEQRGFFRVEDLTECGFFLHG
jgi:hypothetical protein